MKYIILLVSLFLSVSVFSQSSVYKSYLYRDGFLTKEKAYYEDWKSVTSYITIENNSLNVITPNVKAINITVFDKNYSDTEDMGIWRGTENGLEVLVTIQTLPSTKTVNLTIVYLATSKIRQYKFSPENKIQ